MSDWNRTNNDQRAMDNILQTHFNNINILANSVQNSQQIINRIQRENMNNNNRINNIADSLVQSIFNEGTHVNPRTRYRNGTREEPHSQQTNSVASALHDPITPTTGTPPARTPRNYRSAGNQTQNNNYDNDNNVYYFTFDNLLAPSGLNNTTNEYTSGVSYESLLITQANAQIINSNDSSYNSNNYHLYEISHFDLIENPINDICPITRERFDSTTEQILMIKRCRHIFNKSALKIWLENNNSCPCCRGHIS